MRASILLVGLVSALGAAVAAAPSGGTSKALLQRRQTADNDKELEELEAEEAEWQRERKEYVESSTGTCWKEYLKEVSPTPPTKLSIPKSSLFLLPFQDRLHKIYTSMYSSNSVYCDSSRVSR